MGSKQTIDLARVRKVEVEIETPVLPPPPALRARILPPAPIVASVPRAPCSRDFLDRPPLTWPQHGPKRGSERDQWLPSQQQYYTRCAHISYANRYRSFRCFGWYLYGSSSQLLLCTLLTFRRLASPRNSENQHVHSASSQTSSNQDLQTDGGKCQLV